MGLGGWGLAFFLYFLHFLSSSFFGDCVKARVGRVCEWGKSGRKMRAETNCTYLLD